MEEAGPEGSMEKRRWRGEEEGDVKVFGGEEARCKRLGGRAGGQVGGAAGKAGPFGRKDGL